MNYFKTALLLTLFVTNAFAMQREDGSQPRLRDQYPDATQRLIAAANEGKINEAAQALKDGANPAGTHIRVTADFQPWNAAVAKDDGQLYALLLNYSGKKLEKFSPRIDVPPIKFFFTTKKVAIVRVLIESDLYPIDDLDDEINWHTILHPSVDCSQFQTLLLDLSKTKPIQRKLLNVDELL